MERINSYELILYNGHESNWCLQQRFLRQKINSSQIKVCRFQWTPSFTVHKKQKVWNKTREKYMPEQPVDHITINKNG